MTDYLGNLGGAARDKYVVDLWQEAIALTVRQYGSCSPRTHSQQPPNNTPLHLMAKCSYKSWLPTDTYDRLMDTLMEACGDELNAVDNRGSTAFIMAAGAGNVPFIDYCIRRMDFLEERRIDWNHRNIDRCNAFNITDHETSNLAVHNKLMLLVKHGKLDELDHPNRAGRSSANRRNRSAPAIPGTRRAEHQQNRYRQPQGCQP